MRLKSIKLAGFKSFVDPATVHFTSNMSAVVGPNGCGKSNIIDAVRWVMGESSAKNLRGESMTDVIFNGSNTRKPVTQASIELIFDNTDSSLGGKYAAFAEISIRRLVTREAQNTYFLNGTKCRRRDITDIFLGTGLGPRSYSIIEQGMISRLIEARPDDLRQFIEEAAGISKYKERRRETENRIRRTQENLARLSDLREELGRQLERLERQAQAAEKYRHYKDSERHLSAQLLAFRWQGLDSRARALEQQIAEQEITQEALQATQYEADARIEALREQQHEANETFQQAQTHFYRLGAEISRLEEALKHEQQRHQQLQLDLAEAEQASSEAQMQLEADQAQLETLQIELETLEPEREILTATQEQASQRLEEAEQAMQGIQEHWEQQQQQVAELHRQTELQQLRIQQLEQQLEQDGQRARRLAEEQEQLGPATQDEQIETLAARLEELAEQQADLHEQDVGLAESLREQQQQQQQLAQQQQHLQTEQQRQQGRLASLEALQQAALDPDQQTRAWLEQQQLQDSPRLTDTLSVEPGWQSAVEQVLGTDLQALIPDDLQQLSTQALQQGQQSFLHRHPAAPCAPATAAESLLSKVTSAHDLSPWLGRVLTAESLEVAWAMLDRLPDGHSLITRDGCWLSPHFLRILRPGDGEAGILERAAALSQLREAISSTAAQLEALEQQQTILDDSQQQQTDRREAIRQQQQALNSQQADLKAEYSALQVRLEQQQLRRERLEQEQQQLADLQNEAREQLGLARMNLESLTEHMEQAHETREDSQLRRESLRNQLETARQEYRQTETRAHALELQAGTLHSRHAALTEGLNRMQQQLERARSRTQQLQQNLETGTAPQEEAQFNLEALLEQRLLAESALQQAGDGLENTTQQLRNTEQQRQQADQRSQTLRSELEGQRLQWQTLNVQSQTLREQLQAENYDLQGVLDTLGDEASEETLKAELQALNQKIQRLGAINLAAIEEYEQQSERKNYLDRQNQDLEEALDILLNVIHKIDRETRQRFKLTFDQINSGLQELFPKVFGGGSASLELTGEDLLDTGVAIMARPPGKKNSTIHLLSGGEKALTALSLVFAIFQLNPAPFCMLDEVDAPLDDANVGRYARLVKEMSTKVQFIYITHNKIAMEMADQLLGVTMHEPGCSRMVAVDIAEAAALAEA